MDWIAVGLTGDVPAGTVVPRQVAGTDLAIWRSAAGHVHAWGDRCPHRGMRLSHGFVRGETLACIYHGWQYGQDASCSYIPAHPDLTPPKTICAQEYPCDMRGEAIWVALGHSDTPIPDIGTRIPVRSMDIARSADEVAQHLGHPLSALIIPGDGHDLAIALQPCTSNSCLIHVFAGANQDRKQVSRHLEQLRRDIEDVT